LEDVSSVEWEVRANEGGKGQCGEEEEDEAEGVDDTGKGRGGITRAVEGGEGVGEHQDDEGEVG
jgi:hypothetical protein